MIYPYGTKTNYRYRGPLESHKINTSMLDTRKNVDTINDAVDKTNEVVNGLVSDLTFDGFYNLHQEAQYITTANTTKGVIKHG